MSKLFWGFFFIFVNFELKLNGHALNVLPSFVGYILLVQGTRELESESGLFRCVRPFAAGMAVYTGILWLGALLGVGGTGGWLSTLLGLASTLVSLYISWGVLQGLLDMEQRRGADLNGASVRTAWLVLAVSTAISFVLALLLSLMALAGALVALVGIIWFLAALWKSKTLYGTLPPVTAGEKGM